MSPAEWKYQRLQNVASNSAVHYIANEFGNIYISVRIFLALQQLINFFIA